MSLKNNKHLTNCTLTDQGAQRIEFAEFSSFECMIQQSITPLENTPFGGAFLWLGTRQDPMRLDRQRVAELINVLQTWLDTGKLVDDEPAKNNGGRNQNTEIEEDGTIGSMEGI